jgi:hypothetical protein
MGFDTGSMQLPALADQVDRRRMFGMASAQFADALGMSTVSGISPPTALDRGADSGLVLAVHMAALAMVDARRRDEVPPHAATEVSAYLLIRERDALPAPTRQHTNPTSPSRFATWAGRCRSWAAATKPAQPRTKLPRSTDASLEPTHPPTNPRSLER